MTCEPVPPPRAPLKSLVEQSIQTFIGASSTNEVYEPAVLAPFYKTPTFAANLRLYLPIHLPSCGHPHAAAQLLVAAYARQTHLPLVPIPYLTASILASVVSHEKIRPHVETLSFSLAVFADTDKHLGEEPDVDATEVVRLARAVSALPRLKGVYVARGMTPGALPTEDESNMAMALDIRWLHAMKRVDEKRVLYDMADSCCANWTEMQKFPHNE